MEDGAGPGEVVTAGDGSDQAGDGGDVRGGPPTWIWGTWAG